MLAPAGDRWQPVGLEVEADYETDMQTAKK